MGTPDYDPFAMFTLPPPGETPEQRVLREQREAEAQRVSDKIDEQLKQERVALKKQKGIVRVLLLGQSESGKSTTLKNFRMKYARTAWKQERASWRAVIQLNLLRSISTIVGILQAEMDNEPVEPPLTSDGDLEYTYEPSASSTTSRSGSPSSSNTAHQRSATTSPSLAIPGSSAALTGKHQLLKLRLGPLRRVEADLRRRLGAGADEDYGFGSASGVLGHMSSEKSTREFGVRRLKDALESGVQTQVVSRGMSVHGSHHGHGDEDGVDEATEVISSCKDDMKSLWMDESVRAVLIKRKVRLEETAGFFLDDLDRIATRTYEPSDDDVVRARLRTLGVQEYRIQFEPTSQHHFLGSIGQDFGKEWMLYDVGGSRTTRHAWVPYFDNVNAIIFLAPISCFDERLLEDSRVNRLEDSLLLWRSVCSNKLLAKTTMILFLNKYDLLKRKLRNGVMVNNFLPSYGDRANDAPTVVKYLREKFKDILRQQSPEPRVSYFYPTSVTDTKATATTLKTVRDSILREHLKSADFV